MRLENLNEAVKAVERMSPELASRSTTSAGWTPAQILEHCAQSIEYSVRGFPQNKGSIFHATLGRLVSRKFLAQGFMRHSLDAPIPGAPEPEAKNLEAAQARLLAAVAEFRAAQELAPHFAFGKLSRAEFEKLHAFHIADHLGAFEGG